MKQPNIFSDHSRIVCWIKIGTDHSNNNNNFQDKNNVKLPQQYVWDAPMIICLYYFSSKVRNSISAVQMSKMLPIKTLHSEPDPNALSAFQINMLDDKKRLEDSNHLQSELDNPIWIEEIDKVIKKLKNKKTAGLDGIRNEMVKTSSRFFKIST